MMTSALIQHADVSRIPEMQDAATELERRGVLVTRFHAKHLLRGTVPLTRDALVVGEVHVVEAALKQLGIQPTQEQCYPEVLRSFLGRKVWASTMREVTAALLKGAMSEIFVKPRGRIKAFTGRMVDSSDVGSLMHHSASMPVWCGEIVSFASEHRAFVIRSEVKCVQQYGGDERVADGEVIRDCVDRLTQSGTAASAYAIDFGVLRDGRTVLLEVNDGYSLGRYGCAPEVYVDVLGTRWAELVDLSR